MKKHLTIRVVLISIALILIAFIAIQVFDTGHWAKADSPKLERLFEDMGVLELPQTTDPVEIRLQDINGNLVSLSDFRGRIVFLNFWTTWCPTCRIEMPSMEKLHQKFKNQDFAMVTVNIQESASQVEKFYKNFKLTFTTLLDTTGEVAMGFSIRSIPTTFILDNSGRIIGTVIGPREWDDRKAVALFEHLINKYEATSTQITTQ
jgi:thiol-disulfide isomerase/thioredoxin